MVNVSAHRKAALLKQTYPEAAAFGLCIGRNQRPKPGSSALWVCTKLSSSLSHRDTPGTALLKSGKLPLRSENTNESRRETAPSDTNAHAVRQKGVHAALA